MQNLCKPLVLAVIVNFICHVCLAQVPGNQPDHAIDTVGHPVTSIDADLLNIFNQKTPKKYKVAGVTVSGNKFFDEALLLSIAGISVGDEITIPGGDNFSRAIQKLWSQNYFSDVEVYITKLQGTDIYVEIAVTERPRLSKFLFKGIKKAEADELNTKTGLVTSQVITENMKMSAIAAIDKYYAEKGFRSVEVSINEKPDSAYANSMILTFNITKGNKVKINQINFVDNTIDELALKKQMKGTKEMSRLTLFPTGDQTALANPTKYTFSDYLRDKGYFTFTKTKRVLDPYVRLKLFTSAKFNEKKYEEDKDHLLDYYNSHGYRDAAIVKDTQYYNNKGNMNIDIKVDEGHKYYFGNITWRGNTKYSDSLLTTILGIKKGDTYNLDILNKKLGKSLSPEGGDISGLYMDDGYLVFQNRSCRNCGIQRYHRL